MTGQMPDDPFSDEPRGAAAMRALEEASRRGPNSWANTVVALSSAPGVGVRQFARRATAGARGLAGKLAGVGRAHDAGQRPDDGEEHPDAS